MKYRITNAQYISWDEEEAHPWVALDAWFNKNACQMLKFIVTRFRFGTTFWVQLHSFDNLSFRFVCETSFVIFYRYSANVAQGYVFIRSVIGLTWPLPLFVSLYNSTNAFQKVLVPRRNVVSFINKRLTHLEIRIYWQDIFFRIQKIIYCFQHLMVR